MNKVKQKYIYGGIATLFIFGLIIFSSTISIPKGANTASLLSPLWSLLGYSSEKEILSYFFKEPVLIEGTFKEYNSQKYIFIEVPVNIKRTGLTPIIKVSPGASVSPASLFSPDYFKQPVVYTVTAEDGTTQKYKVYVTGVPAIELPKSISTCQELQDINLYLSGSYTLINDIDCSGINFIPIGSGVFWEGFSGILNGDGYTIKNLSILKDSYGFSGLFSSLSGKVLNLKVVGSVGQTSRETGDVGGIAGYLTYNGSITDSSFVGSVSGRHIVGGLVGGSSGTISSSYSLGSVYSSASGYMCKSGCYTGVGGLVGNLANNALIKNSYSGSKVSIAGAWPYPISKAGGLVGFILDYSSVQIINSYSYGSASGNIMGGLVASVQNNSSIINSYWDTQVSGQTTSANGVGKTTAEMKTPSTFSNWDTNIWSLVDGAYPTLKEPVTCDSFDYSDWSTCTNQKQTRIITNSLPDGCIGGSHVTSQSCVVCTSFTYSGWDSCSLGTQKRTVITSLPNGCTGGNPDISHSCDGSLQWSTKQGNMAWDTAVAYCANPANGYTRLPTKDELDKALTEQFIKKNPSVNGFIENTSYWSGTESDNHLNGWHSNADYSGYLYSNFNSKDYTHSVRCVR